MPTLAHCLKIIYVEDHEITRLGVLPLLRMLCENVHIYEASSYAELCNLESQADDIGLIVLDLSLPDIKEEVAILEVKDIFKHTPLVILSTIQSHDRVLRSIDQGADGFIEKDIPARAIVHALRLILSGVKYFPYLWSYTNMAISGRQDISKSFASGKAKNNDESIENYAKYSQALTHRQTEVLQLISRGLTNKQIARTLNISPGTVKNHVAEVLRILNFQNRREAIYEMLSGPIARSTILPTGATPAIRVSA